MLDRYGGLLIEIGSLRNFDAFLISEKYFNPFLKIKFLNMDLNNNEIVSKYDQFEMKFISKPKSRFIFKLNISQNFH